MIKTVIALCVFAIGHNLETDGQTVVAYYSRPLFERLSLVNAIARKLNPRVCVIGAGVGGLSAARHLKGEGVNFVVLESTNYVGGTWRYDERVGNDEYGLPIHTSMYKHLRTNLPKVTMELPNFPMAEDVPSFLTWKHFYDYLKSYAKHFDLERYIKLLHQVTSVKRVGEVWKVKYEHIPTGKEFEDSFDYVIVATGHHSKPQMPYFPGEELFKGTIIHSHDYREPDPYKCRRVLIIGSGPSGMDIGLDVANVSKSLIHSHHSRVNFQTPFPPNYVKKPDVKEFNETGAIFVDGTFEELDDIIYCTGFQYSYPFLDESSGLTIAPRSVTPLHKLVLNINQPTMLVFGAITRACLIISLDAQARYAAALIKGYFEPPSREEMMEELQRRYDALRAKGRPLYYVHMLAEKEDQYYAELSRESGIERVPPVISKIHAADAEAIFKNLYTFRNYEYTVIDDEAYSKVLLDIEVPHMSVNCSATNQV